MMIESPVGSASLFNEVINFSYAAHTKYAFALTETVAIAELRCQGLEYDMIKQRVVVDDLLQIQISNIAARCISDNLAAFREATI